MSRETGWGDGRYDSQAAKHKGRYVSDRIGNEDNESGWITLHFQSLEDAREARAALKTVIKVGARNM